MFGISFAVQSAEYDPIFLQEKIFEFIDNFYHDQLNQENFEKFKAGCLGRLRAGYKGLTDEASELYSRFTHFSIDQNDGIIWDDKAQEIQYIEELTLDRVRKFYKNLFNPHPKKKGGLFN